MNWKERKSHMELFRVLVSIIGILLFVSVIGLFGLIIGKYCVFGGNKEIKQELFVPNIHYENKDKYKIR